ncbi:MAG: DUF29 domain-containing protein [Emticicia sp.]|nr:DUF29 domain-containing protein [Emticicia sp.]
MDVEEGLTQLIDVMAKAEQRALLSHLINLMMHIIKWQIQPQKRTRSWLKTIFNARYEVELAQDFNPSLNENFLKSIWDKAFLRAKKGAEIETGILTTKLKHSLGKKFLSKNIICKKDVITEKPTFLEV